MSHFIVGLTGGIGSGKTSVADRFAEQGVTIIDTDAIAHELTGVQGASLPHIEAVFGRAVLLDTGELNRVAMRRLVFVDPAAKRQLEAILHPMIRAESERRCRMPPIGAPYVILVVPLLVESSAYREYVARILLVDCDESLQITRVMARSKLSRDEVEAIIKTQASRAERRAAADDILSNDKDLESVRAQVLALHEKYLQYVFAMNNEQG